MTRLSLKFDALNTDISQSTIRNAVAKGVTKPKVYKTFCMVNPTKHEFKLHIKNLNAEKYRPFLLSNGKMLYLTC